MREEERFCFVRIDVRSKWGQQTSHLTQSLCFFPYGTIYYYIINFITKSFQRFKIYGCSSWGQTRWKEVDWIALKCFKAIEIRFWMYQWIPCNSLKETEMHSKEFDCFLQTPEYFTFNNNVYLQVFGTPMAHQFHLYSQTLSWMIWKMIACEFLKINVMALLYFIIGL